MPRLKKLCDKYGVKNIDVCRRWLANSDLDPETVVMDVMKIEKMHFQEDKKGVVEAVQTGQIIGCGEEFDNHFLSMLEDEYGSKDSTESAGYRFIKEVGRA